MNPPPIDNELRLRLAKRDRLILWLAIVSYSAAVLSVVCAIGIAIHFIRKFW